MQNRQKRQIIQKLWGWICLSVNCFVMTLHLAEQHAEFLKGGILLSLLTICYGAIKTQMDKLKGDTSVTSVVIEYVCVYIITFLIGFKLATYLSSVSVLIWLIIASLVEMIVFLLFTYWRAICRFLGTRGRFSCPLRKRPDRP